jgi:hypothetical protein
MRAPSPSPTRAPELNFFPTLVSKLNLSTPRERGHPSTATKRKHTAANLKKLVGEQRERQKGMAGSGTKHLIIFFNLINFYVI